MGNTSQLTTILGMALALIGTVLTSTGYVTPADWSNLSHLLMDAITSGVALVGAIMVWWQTRHPAQAKAASAIPGVTVTASASAAPAAVVAVANDNGNAVKLAA